MADDFVVTGTRPPSAAGIRPLAASSKDFGYYTKKPHSTVDETLFRSHHTSSLNAPVTFAAPWEKKLKGSAELKKPKTKPVRPLLWAPASTSNHFNNRTFSKDSVDDADSSISSYTFGTIQGIPLKHQYKRLKHTPTFVDETLFGEPLQEPSFKAPWEEKKKVKQVYKWNSEHDDERKPVRRRRPVTALGLRSSVSSNAVPVWKP